MAQYTGPDPNTLLPGDPWTSALAQAAFEDPIAIVEGAPGAPRLYGKAAVPRPQQAELVVLTGLTAADSPTLDNLHYSGDFSTTETGSTSYVTSGTVTSVLMSGTVRAIAFCTAIESGIGVSNSDFRLLKNGTVVQTFNLSGSITISDTFSVDVAVIVGDTFEWQIKRNSGSARISGQTFGASDAYTRIGIPIKGSDL